MDISDTLSHSSDDEDLDCPLCMEEIDVTDKYFKPCPCGYQICRFCWNHIKENLNGLCPACRRQYSEDTVEFTPVSGEELQRIKNKKKKKERERKEQELVARRHLANIRVVQKNLVYVLGLPAKICSEEILRSQDYFGQYGKITRIVVNRRGHTPSASGATGNGVYVTFNRKEDATKAIEAVDGSVYDGKIIRATYGTTKYCSYFLRNQACQNPNCQYLHEVGEEADAHAHVKDDPSTFKESKIPKPPPFPIPSSKKDDREESMLPPTANWAKQIKPIGSTHQSIASPVAYSSQTPISVPFSQTPEPTDLDADTDIPPLSRVVRAESDKANVEGLRRGKQKAKVSVTNNPPPGLKQSGTPTMLKGSGTLSQQSDEVRGSSALDGSEPRLSPTSTRSPSTTLASPEKNTEPVIERKDVGDQVASLSPVKRFGIASLASYGLIMHTKYNGPFDPFDSDPLALLTSHEMAALKNSETETNTFGRVDLQRSDLTQSNTIANAAKRGRFERFFANGESESGFDEAEQRKPAPEALRAVFPNQSGTSVMNTNTIQASTISDMWNQGYPSVNQMQATRQTQPQILQQQQQQLPFAYPSSLRVNPATQYGQQVGLSVRQQQELLQQQQQLIQQQAFLGRLQQQQQLAALAQNQQQSFAGLQQDDYLSHFLRESQYKNVGVQRTNPAMSQASDIGFRDPAIMMAKLAASSAGVGPAPGFESRARIRGFDGIPTPGTAQQSDWNTGNPQNESVPSPFLAPIIPPSLLTPSNANWISFSQPPFDPLSINGWAEQIPAQPFFDFQTPPVPRPPLIFEKANDLEACELLGCSIFKPTFDSLPKPDFETQSNMRFVKLQLSQRKDLPDISSEIVVAEAWPMLQSTKKKSSHGLKKLLKRWERTEKLVVPQLRVTLLKSQGQKDHEDAKADQIRKENIKSEADTHSENLGLEIAKIPKNQKEIPVDKALEKPDLPEKIKPESEQPTREVLKIPAEHIEKKVEKKAFERSLRKVVSIKAISTNIEKNVPEKQTPEPVPGSPFKENEKESEKREQSARDVASVNAPSQRRSSATQKVESVRRPSTPSKMDAKKEEVIVSAVPVNLQQESNWSLADSPRLKKKKKNLGVLPEKFQEMTKRAAAALAAAQSEQVEATTTDALKDTLNVESGNKETTNSQKRTETTVSDSQKVGTLNTSKKTREKPTNESHSISPSTADSTTSSKTHAQQLPRKVPSKDQVIKKEDKNATTNIESVAGAAKKTPVVTKKPVLTPSATQNQTANVSQTAEVKMSTQQASIPSQTTRVAVDRNSSIHTTSQSAVKEVSMKGTSKLIIPPQITLDAKSPADESCTKIEIDPNSIFNVLASLSSTSNIQAPARTAPWANYKVPPNVTISGPASRICAMEKSSMEKAVPSETSASLNERNTALGLGNLTQLISTLGSLAVSVAAAADTTSGLSGSNEVQINQIEQALKMLLNTATILHEGIEHSEDVQKMEILKKQFEVDDESDEEDASFHSYQNEEDSHFLASEETKKKLLSQFSSQKAAPNEHNMNTAKPEKMVIEKSSADSVPGANILSLNRNPSSRMIKVKKQKSKLAGQRKPQGSTPLKQPSHQIVSTQFVSAVGAAASAAANALAALPAGQHTDALKQKVDSRNMSAIAVAAMSEIIGMRFNSDPQTQAAVDDLKRKLTLVKFGIDQVSQRVKDQCAAEQKEKLAQTDLAAVNERVAIVNERIDIISGALQSNAAKLSTLLTDVASLQSAELEGNRDDFTVSTAEVELKQEINVSDMDEQANGVSDEEFEGDSEVNDLYSRLDSYQSLFMSELRKSIDKGENVLKKPSLGSTLLQKPELAEIAEIATNKSVSNAANLMSSGNKTGFSRQASSSKAAKKKKAKSNQRRGLTPQPQNGSTMSFRIAQSANGCGLGIEVDLQGLNDAISSAGYSASISNEDMKSILNEAASAVFESGEENYGPAVVAGMLTGLGIVNSENSESVMSSFPGLIPWNKIKEKMEVDNSSSSSAPRSEQDKAAFAFVTAAAKAAENMANSLPTGNSEVGILPPNPVVEALQKEIEKNRSEEMQKERELMRVIERNNIWKRQLSAIFGKPSNPSGWDLSKIEISGPNKENFEKFLEENNPFEFDEDFNAGDNDDVEYEDEPTDDENYEDEEYSDNEEENIRRFEGRIREEAMMIL